MKFNATFKNISAISWRSVLLVKETGVPREDHWHAARHWHTLSHNVVSSNSGRIHIQYMWIYIVRKNKIYLYKL